MRFGVGFVFAIARPFQQIMSGVRLRGENDGRSLAHNIAGTQNIAVFDLRGKGSVGRLRVEGDAPDAGENSANLP